MLTNINGNTQFTEKYCNFREGFNCCKITIKKVKWCEVYEINHFLKKVKVTNVLLIEVVTRDLVDCVSAFLS